MHTADEKNEPLSEVPDGDGRNEAVDEPVLKLDVEPIEDEDAPPAADTDNKSTFESRRVAVGA